MDTKVACVSPDELSEVLERFDQTYSWSLPVVQNRKFLGLISKAALLNYYRGELMVQEEK